MTKAYVISEVRPRDAEAMERHRAPAAASIAVHGGRYLVRGAVPEVLGARCRPPASSRPG